MREHGEAPLRLGGEPDPENKATPLTRSLKSTAELLTVALLAEAAEVGVLETALALEL